MLLPASVSLPGAGRGPGAPGVAHRASFNLHSIAETPPALPTGA